jgi:hypothetical protein
MGLPPNDQGGYVAVSLHEYGGASPSGKGEHPRFIKRVDGGGSPSLFACRDDIRKSRKLLERNGYFSPDWRSDPQCPSMRRGRAMKEDYQNIC